MAWSTPHTYIDGDVVSAANLNETRDNLRYLKGLDGVPRIESALELPEAATPTTPASGYGRLYFKTDGRAYTLDDSGNERVATPGQGSFTPVYLGATVAGVTTHTLQYGSYEQRGNRMHVTLRITWTAATGSGNPRIGGLPVAAAASSHAVLTVFPVNYTFAGAGLVAFTGNGVSYLELFTPTSGGLANAAFDTAADLIITGDYAI